MWEAKPHNLLNGTGCPECWKRNKQTSKDEVIRRIRKANVNIEMVGRYNGTHKKTKFHCIVCDYIWEQKPNVILSGCGCPNCSHRITLDDKQFEKKLSELNPNIEVVGGYFGTMKKTKFKCRRCSYEWETLPNNVFSHNSDCPKCSNRLKKTHDEFVELMSKISPNIKILGTYDGRNREVKCECLKCGYVWEVPASSLLSGRGCANCNSSKGEERISTFLDSKNIKYIREYVFKNLRRMRFDFYLPDYGIAIEYDGIQHFKPIDFAGKGEEWAKSNLKDTKKRDKAKTEFCKTNNIPLLRILYTDSDVENKLGEFINTYKPQFN